MKTQVMLIAAVMLSGCRTVKRSCAAIKPRQRASRTKKTYCGAVPRIYSGVIPTLPDTRK